MITYGAIKSGEQMVRVGGDVRDLDIHLPDIRPDQSAQPRENLHNDRIAEYAESMKAGDQFPPLTVFHNGEVYWLADGFHRFYAAQHAGRKHIRCYVRQGGLRDAILYSVGANAKHGLARSDADKERAVLRLLNDAEWSTWTDRDIAKRCYVSHPFVAKVRKAHAGVTGNVSSERTYTTKHGTTATMKTAGINASRTQFQAKASEDNGSITGGAGAVTGEASRLASGRTDAGEVASVDLPTIPRNIVAEILALWAEANEDEREQVLAHINPPAPEHKAAGHARREMGSNGANEGGNDVDGGASRAGHADQRELAVPGHIENRGRDENFVERTTSGPDAKRALNSNPQPKTPGDADKAEADRPPTASANPFTNPRCQKPETCHLVHSRNECFDCTMAWAKRPKDEQVRLWAEAIQAARAA